MQYKFLRVSSLVLLQIAIVGNLQVLPANASYGASLPFLYFFAIIGFFLPCTLMVAELATTRPQTGGAYIWCEQAFGPQVSFFTVTILWISNLLWYPSIFSLIATNFAYLFNKSLAQNKLFIVTFNVFLFWFFTGLNCLGVKFSSRTSIACSILGIIIPIILIILGGLIWCLKGQPSAISFTHTSMLPNLNNINNLSLLIAIVISLFGIEITAVHAGNVVNPKRDYPLSLLIAGILLLIFLLSAELAIAAIIPLNKLSVVTGLLDALIIFFDSIHLSYLISLVLFLILIGNLGSVAAWMLGSTRSMAIACQKNQVASILQKTNRYEAPIGVLICEAFIFSFVSTIFLIFPSIIDSFWLLLDLAAQISLIYYIILFVSAVRLRYLPTIAEGFVLPGGNILFVIIMLIGALTSLLALSTGFIAPANLDARSISLFHWIMILGLIFTLIFPFMLLLIKSKK
ncbi:Amino acid transporter [Legionella busanensis]|uniref:Amino acid transporter n=1 Tax=Legionella busanensis TaxID=190655 RepID=A0A378JSB8_9GAMM|nr:APC family permease [Legionella busanensis]STX51062.1 Amino acid transporter [Legionella busanensis]